MEKEIYSDFFPYGDTQRVGNFKLWRAKQKIKTSNGPMEIDSVNVSTLSGEWMVRIPDTYEMYGLLMSLFNDYKEGSDENKKRAEVFLAKVFSNMMFASVVGNGYFHRGLEMVAMVYANPTLLSEKGQVQDEFMKDIKETIDEFLEWRKGYDAERAKYEPTEEQDRQENLADQAAQILSE